MSVNQRSNSHLAKRLKSRSTDNITDKMVNEYLDHDRTSQNDNDTFILE